MDYVKREILKMIKENKSKKEARNVSEKWFSDALKSRKDKSVEKIIKPFEPGKIYVFDYVNPVTKETLDWWDMNPVVLALLPIDKTTDCGINLNLLPVKFKEEFLDNFYKMYHSQIAAQSTGAKKDNASLQGPLRTLRYEVVKKYLDNFGFGFAIRRYKTHLKKNQAVVSYESWAKIALCDFIKLNGASPWQIKRLFTEYYRNMNI